LNVAKCLLGVDLLEEKIAEEGARIRRRLVAKVRVQREKARRKVALKAPYRIGTISKPRPTLL